MSIYRSNGVCWSNVATSFGDQSADSPQPTHQPSVPIVQPFTHTEVLKGLSCGSLWELSLSCRVYSIDASSHRLRPSDHMCVNERSVVATISGGNSQCSDYMMEATAVPGDRNRCSTWMLAYSDDLLCCVRRTSILLISFFLSQSMCVCVCVCVCVQHCPALPAACSTVSYGGVCFRVEGAAAAGQGADAAAGARPCMPASS